MIDYNPEDAVTVWPDGDYDAELKKVEEKTSKTSGNPMEVWTIAVFNADGDERSVTEYVVFPAAVFKVKQLAAAMGRKPEFDSAQFHAKNYIGAGFKVKLAIDKQDGFDDKNKIAKYYEAVDQAGIPAKRQGSPFEGKPNVFDPAEIGF